MNEASSAPAAQHAAFTIERRFSQPPARVFAAWAEPKAKAQRFTAPAESSSVLA